MIQVQKISSLEDLNINLGISDVQIDQLIEYTNTDPEIKKLTSDLKRFPDKESFDKWNQGKTIYTLTDNNHLLGLIWFEKKDLPFETQGLNSHAYKATIAIRTYANARGKGYFKPFLTEVLNHYKNMEQISNFWISIAKDNIPSQNAFLKFGFKVLENPQNTERVFMVYSTRT